MTALRISGSVGLGGPLGTLFFPLRLGQPLMLKEGVSDHGHQRVPMKTVPGAPLEVVESEFLLHLLVCLFAHPSGLDACRQRQDVGVGGQIGEIVFALVRRSPFADQPSLLARQVLLTLVEDALGWRARPRVVRQRPAIETMRWPLQRSWIEADRGEWRNRPALP